MSTTYANLHTDIDQTRSPEDPELGVGVHVRGQEIRRKCINLLDYFTTRAPKVLTTGRDSSTGIKSNHLEPSYAEEVVAYRVVATQPLSDWLTSGNPSLVSLRIFDVF